MQEKTITVLRIETEQPPKIVTIQNDLASLQEAVGGTIQALYPFPDEVALIANDEGKLMGLPLNRALTDENGVVYDVIAGPFLVVGLGEDDFTSLPPELLEKYSQRFAAPEMFMRVDDHIVVIRM